MARYDQCSKGRTEGPAPGCPWSVTPGGSRILRAKQGSPQELQQLSCNFRCGSSHATSLLPTVLTRNFEMSVRGLRTLQHLLELGTP